MRNVLLTLVLFCTSSLGWGAQLGLTATGILSVSDPRFYTLGWSFQVNTPIAITALGYFDADQDGLLDSHTVGIFNGGGSLLVSTTVGSGLAGTLVEHWRMTPITPFTLNPGLYVIASEQGGSSDPIVFQADSIATGPEVSLVDPTRFTFGTGLLFPTERGLTYLQPNFLYASTVIPEPGTAALFLTAVGVAVGQWIRRRH